MRIKRWRKFHCSNRNDKLGISLIRNIQKKYVDNFKTLERSRRHTSNNMKIYMQSYSLQHCLEFQNTVNNLNTLL